MKRNLTWALLVTLASISPAHGQTGEGFESDIWNLIGGDSAYDEFCILAYQEIIILNSSAISQFQETKPNEHSSLLIRYVIRQNHYLDSLVSIHAKNSINPRFLRAHKLEELIAKMPKLKELRRKYPLDYAATLDECDRFWEPDVAN